MNRMFVLCVIVATLAALSSCHEGQLHWIRAVPPLPSVAPTMVPEKSLMPTITPDANYHCDRYRVIWCQLHYEQEEM